MPSAVLATLRNWWDAEIPTTIPNNARVRDLTLLERRVRTTMPHGALAPPDLLEAALKRLHLAPKLVEPITINDLPDIKGIWRPLILQLCDVVPVRWIASSHSRRSWFPGVIETRPAGSGLLVSADVCADPRSEVREALRWARARIAEDGIPPNEIAVTVASPTAWDDTFLVLAREAGILLHFTHGVPALATREGQTCAALADILLRGISQERVRRLLARAPPAREQIPVDWAKGLRRCSCWRGFCCKSWVTTCEVARTDGLRRRRRRWWRRRWSAPACRDRRCCEPVPSGSSPSLQTRPAFVVRSASWRTQAPVGPGV